MATTTAGVLEITTCAETLPGHEQFGALPPTQTSDMSFVTHGARRFGRHTVAVVAVATAVGVTVVGVTSAAAAAAVDEFVHSDRGAQLHTDLLLSASGSMTR